MPAIATFASNRAARVTERSLLGSAAGATDDAIYFAIALNRRGTLTEPPADAQWAEVRDSICDHLTIVVDLLCAERDGEARIATVSRHWFLDQPSPR